jgi:hypothetical protein
MHSQLNYIKAQQRIEELSRAAAYRRVEDQSRSERRPARPRPIRRVAALFGRISAARA